MRHPRLLLLALAALAAVPAAAQPRPRPATPPRAAAPATPPAPMPNNTEFAPIALPTPNAARLADGRPGREYWQQRADYRIRASLSPGAHRVAGTVTIRYTNGAPEALNHLWLALEQNLFKPNSLGDAIQPANSRWRGSFAAGGYTISRVEVSQGGASYAPAYVIDDTRMRIDLRQPLAANDGVVELSIDYAFVVPEYGADRMGRYESAKGTVYELAQWYPRMYVYDDVNGWNAMPYYGQGEFYLSFGDYDVEITTPADMIVAATGTLDNPGDVLTREQRSRYDRAKTSTETVMIVSNDEIGRPETRPRPESGTLTWRFKAENVRDFAWAASKAFIWDAASTKAGMEADAPNVLVQSYYPPEGIGTPGQATEGWEKSTQYLRHTISYYSGQWYRYPYAQASNIAGVVGGMEYPMIVFCGVRARGPGLFGVTDHEFGHTWFPMIVGSDERRHAWMDEGFNTFINAYSNVAYYGAGATRAARTGAAAIAGATTSPLWQQPIMTYPDATNRNALGLLAYSKPGAGLVLLREYIVGPERFDAAFRAYIDRWAFKHPQPADFFRTIEDVTGDDLDYFWRGWFQTTDTFDQAITAVETVSDTLTNVTVANRQGLILPASLEVTFADGSVERFRIPAIAFATSDAFAYPVTGKRVRSLRLDPDGLLPDVDRSNDTWGTAGTGTPTVEPRPSGGTPRRN